MNLKTGTRLGSYEVIDRLGSGAMGEVYRARDPRLRRNVALKVLPDELAADAERLRRFEREALTISSLNHPNIIHIYDIGEERGRRFVAMELVEGRTLREIIDADSVAFEQVTDLACQIAEGLVKAHSAGVVHRDLKPENLMVNADGHVKILDFGLAKLVGSHAESSETRTLTKLGTVPGVILGTVGYMSPEQARGEPADARSDQFSFGAVLYELACGDRAFCAPSPVETLAAILGKEPGPLPRRVEALDPLLRRCLAKNSSARFDSMADVAKALRALRDERPASQPRSQDPIRHTVGREKDLLHLKSALDAARAGRGSLQCIAGEAGIGKTTLVETFLSGLDSEIVIRGRCSERLAGAEAYLPFLEALDTFSGDERLLSLMGKTAPRWHEQVAVSPSERVALREDSSQEPMKREMTAFLGELTKLATVVLFLDDLHWADLSTVDLIAYLGSRLRGMRLLLVATYRPTDLQLSNHPLVAVTLDLQARSSAQELLLPFLSPDHVARYVELEFPDHDFPAEFSTLIYEKTEGSPLFMVNLLHYLRDNGTLVEQGGGWTIEGTLRSVENELPQSVRGMIERKLGRLSKEDRALMLAASVEGYDFRSTVLAQVLERDAAEIEEQLDVLDRVHGLVRFIGEEDLPDGTLTGLYRFVHVLYQNALDATLTPSRRVSLSRRVAIAMASHFEGELRKVATDLAVLWESGRDWARAAHCYRLASENANRVHASREAVRLGERGLEMLRRLDGTAEAREDELHLLLELGRAVVALRGHADARVGDLYLRSWELCQQLDDPEHLASVLNGLWGYRAVRGDLCGAMEVGQRLLEVAEEQKRPEALGLAHLELGLVRFYQGRFRESSRHLENALELAPRGDTQAVGFGLDVRVNARRMMAFVEWVQGHADRARASILEALRLAEASGHPLTRAYVLFFDAFLASILRDEAKTEESAVTLIGLSKDRGFELFRNWGELLRSWCRGNAEGMRGRIEVVRNEQGAGLLLPFWLALVAELELERGAHEAALATLAEARSVQETTGQLFWLAEIWRLEGEALSGDNAAEDVIEAAFQKSLEISRREGARSLELRAATSLGRFWVGRGRSREAAAMLSEVYGSFAEGFDTHDVRAASSLLATLRNPSPGGTT